MSNRKDKPEKWSGQTANTAYVRAGLNCVRSTEKRLKQTLGTTLLPLAAVLLIGLLLVAATWATRNVNAPVDQRTAQRPPIQVPVEQTAVQQEPVQPLSAGKAGLGANLGTGISINELSNRFQRYKRIVPVEFQNLRALIRFSETADDLHVTLVAGPFANSADLEGFCRIVRLQLSCHCESTPYEGDALSVGRR